MSDTAAPPLQPDAAPPGPAPGAGGVSDLRYLEPARIIETIEALAQRVEERFPGRGLARVARQQVVIARNTVAQLEWVPKPILWVRIAVVGVVALLVLLLVGIAMRINVRADGIRLPELLQATESAINELILFGAAVLFLTTVEGRIKRRKALVALRELRALAHIVDMHQLTKDPDRVMEAHRSDTPSSPQPTLTRYQLSRYLDYCSEMLALNSKLAALYAQTLDDPVVLAAVDEVETLTTGLCAKIWQKLVIVNGAEG
jgi:hypothetical protein